MATYQAFVAPIVDTLAHFKAWAQFFGAGFTTIGWASMAGTGTVNTSGTAVTWASGTTFKTEWAGSSIIINAVNYTITTVNSTTSITLSGSAGTQTGVAFTAGFGTILATGTGATYAFTNATAISAALSTGVQSMSVWTYRGQWVSGQTYPNGSNTANGTADLVTDASNGVTYVKITTNVATSLTTAPSSNATDWAPYQYDIWKSQGSNSTGTNPFPIYVRLAYVQQGTSGTMRTHLSIGTGVDINGNLTGACQLIGSSPITSVNWDNATVQSVTPGEMDFAGDTDNFRWVTFRGFTTANLISTIVVDRNRDASGNSGNAFAYVGTIMCSAGSNNTRSQLLVNPVMGSSPQQVNVNGWTGTMTACSTTIVTTLFGGIPPFLCFPAPGYCANPLLGCVGFHIKDVADGATIPVWTYGASHYYIVNTFSGSTALAQSMDGQSSGPVIPSILWE